MCEDLPWSDVKSQAHIIMVMSISVYSPTNMTKGEVERGGGGGAFCNKQHLRDFNSDKMLLLKSKLPFGFSAVSFGWDFFLSAAQRWLLLATR